jgi:2,4-dienoyl-CoA reductase-like NADH-dependent reductase (Old Yellow Enzyme family)
MQIIHSGVLNNESKEEIYGPSNTYNPLFQTQNKELSKDDILKLEDDFVKGAIRAKKSGFDGIDIHAAHLTLLNQFLSPAFNKRNDEYGGSDENRARIIVEIIEKIRKSVGNDFIISVKINVIDGVENGINEKGLLTACKLIEKAGADFIQTSGNYAEHKIKPKSPIFYEEGKKIAEVVNIPVVLIGGIRDMETMEEVLNKSKIEYFGVGRPLVCEPDLVKRWEKGERYKSKCIGCNTCVKNLAHSCVLNKKK